MNRITGGIIAALCLVPLAQAYRRGRLARGLPRWHGPAELKDWPTVSVIIPAWCERGTLEACLANAQQVDYPAYEIIVAAGGPDGTYEAAEQLSREDGRMRVIRQRTEGGKNGAMNDGVRCASGDVLVFLDADGLVPTRWLKALVTALGDCESGQVCAASTGRFVPLQSTLVARAGEMNQVLEYEARGRVSLQGSGSMAVRRAAWDAIGELPEGPYADDWDLNARLRHRGLDISHAPDALVWTERPGTLSQWWANELRWRRIHLASLFRVARAEMPNALAATRALYPYIIGWLFVALGLATVVGRLLRARSPGLETLWLGTVAPALVREVAGAVETAAYTGNTRWLSVMSVLPALTVLDWIAGVIASLTSNRAPVHFKGPREWMSCITSADLESRPAVRLCDSVDDTPAEVAAWG